MLRVEFQIGLSGIPLQLLETGENIESIEVDNAFPVPDSGELLFLTVCSGSSVSEEQLSADLPDADIVYVSRTGVSHHTYHVSVVADRSNLTVLSLLTENRAVPHRIVGRNAHLEVVTSVRDWQHLKQVAGAVEEVHGSLKLVGTTQTDRPGFPLGTDKVRQSVSGKLSEQQLSVLETAYQMGFFQVPQEATAEEIAGELGISRSTLSERLRRVQHNFCTLLFGAYR